MPFPRSVLLGQQDLNRIEALLHRSKADDYRQLFDELDAATVMPDHLLPRDVVVMNSRVTFLDLDTGLESAVKLVYPDEAGAAAGNVSILAPVGAALLGLRVGESIEWPLPGGGRRRLQVVSQERQ
ncbi:MAG: nucleoside diphosphate kinase regulator [Halieaceae bacterium]|nr:nucleoside diphosphate kinase regulator [Halieaceae bacterium]